MKDSKLFAAMVTPGETVSVQTPAQLGIGALDDEIIAALRKNKDRVQALIK